MKNLFERLDSFFRHPPKLIQVILWSLALSFFIVVFAVSFNRPVKLVFNYSLQLIEVEIGQGKTQIPANITIEEGKMYINDIPIRDWLETQGYEVVWDDTSKSAIATQK